MFAKPTAEWLNPNGAFKYLYKLNDIRLPYITSTLDVKGKKILDVGAGGGILSLPLLQMGAHVTSIDIESTNIDVMREIKNTRNLENWSISKKNLFDLKDDYDLVIASEVIEHVKNQHDFLQKCCELTGKTGNVIVSTMNKTLISHFITIVMAEQILDKIEKGTHDSNYYVCPEDVNLKGYQLNNVKSFLLNPLTDSFTFNTWPMVHWIGTLSRT